MRRLELEGLPVDNEYGYNLEADLEYPREPTLHDNHRGLPFCPKVRRTPADCLPYTPEELLMSGTRKSSKLMATLMDKELYVIHYRYLQQALANGLRIQRVHRAMRFKQSTWLKPFVTMNSELRQQARN